MEKRRPFTRPYSTPLRCCSPDRHAWQFARTQGARRRLSEPRSAGKASPAWCSRHRLISSGVKERTNKSPRWRCENGQEFADPRCAGFGVTEPDDHCRALNDARPFALITRGTVANLTDFDVRTVRLWDSSTRQELAKLTGRTNINRAVAYTPDGIASAGPNDQDLQSCLIKRNPKVSESHGRGGSVRVFSG